MVLPERNAALGCRSVRAAQMHENCTAFSGHRRAVIMSQHNNNVVHMVLAPKFLMAVSIGQLYGLVVVARRRIITPARIRPDFFDRQGGNRAGDAISPVHDKTHWPTPGRRGAITFKFAVCDACGPDNAGKGYCAHGQSRYMTIGGHMPDRNFLIKSSHA